MPLKPHRRHRPKLGPVQERRQLQGTLYYGLDHACGMNYWTLADVSRDAAFGRHGRLCAGRAVRRHERHRRRRTVAIAKDADTVILAVDTDLTWDEGVARRQQHRVPERAWRRRS